MTMNPHSEPVIPTRPLKVKVIGVGTAGANALEHMARTDLGRLDLALVHTNVRTLQNATIPTRLVIGVHKTHGLGSRGDRDFARVLAEGETEQLEALCTDADLIFIVTGLGGGTGSGISPVLARLAKKANALVVGVVTMPFEFEGPWRNKQAAAGLHELKAASDAVICLPNQKVCKLVDEKTSVLHAFAVTNELMAQGVRGIWQMLTRPGLINVDFAYLYSVLRGRHAESAFATAHASGEHRAREVVEQLAANPLLDNGQALAEAENLLINIVGGPELSIADVNMVMEQINRRVESPQIIMGASIDENSGGSIALTVIATRVSKSMTVDQSDALRRLPAPGEVETSFFDSAPAAVPRPVSRFKAPPPPTTPETTAELFLAQPSGKKKKFKAQQTLLPLEIVSRGRFDKSQPTIHHGADLDVPTYIRRGVPLN